MGRLYERLRAQDTEVLVIGGGTEEQAAHLAARRGLPMPVLADPEGAVCQAYELHKALFVIQRSATFLVDGEGVIRHIQSSIDPRDSLDVKKLLGAVTSLQGTGETAVDGNARLGKPGEDTA